MLQPVSNECKQCKLYICQIVYFSLHPAPVQVSRTPFDPPAFNPAKLTVAYELGCTPLAPPPLDARRYTLTHNDLTGALQLSIGRHFNLPQLSGELKLVT